jgi:CRISPR-associated protein Cmr2
MKRIITKFKDRTFLVPYVNEADDLLFTESSKAGLFPDRFIFLRKNEDDCEVLKNTLNDTVEMIASKIASDLEIQNDLQLKRYFQLYFRNYAIEMQLNDSENPLWIINRHLDTLELQPIFNQREEQNHLRDFFEKKTIQSVYRNFLIREEAYRDELARREVDEVRFDSIPEITTAELSNRIFETDRGKYWKIFRQENDEKMLDALIAHNKGIELMRYHKYLAIVHADGDFIGKIIEQLFKQTSLPIQQRFSKFSELLFRFAKNAVGVMTRFSATPVYVGGDDVLCLAPLVCNGKNIFDLCRELDLLFENSILKAPALGEALAKIEQNPSLSFGVSISYYKYPLPEALEESHQQLIAEAKRNRNSLSFQVLKHSGSFFGTTLNKSKDVYKVFFPRLLQAQLDRNYDSFLSSLQYTLNANHGILEAIVDDADAVRQFFKHNFNESVHTNSQFVETVRDGLLSAYAETKDPKAAINMIHALLRYVQFINQKIGDE